MASLFFFFWGIVCIVVSVCHAAESDSELILGQLQLLTEAVATQKDEFLSGFHEMTLGIKEEVEVKLNEAKGELQTMNNDCRNDIATLKNLLGANECADASHNCSSNAICTDLVISFKCKCKTGFVGDGYVCEDDDECASKYKCSPDGYCKNHPGGYSCNCNAGYSGDGKTCEEVNECVDGTHECHEYAVCTNTKGNYTCACDLYHKGDGFTCNETAIQSCESPFKAIRGIGCIYIIERSQSFDRSQSDCKGRGADLFVAQNPAHYLRLAKYFIDTNQKAKKKYMYVGVKEGVWLSGRKVAPEEEAPGNPTMKSGRCSYTDGDTSEKFLLWTDPCSYDWWAICERKVVKE